MTETTEVPAARVKAGRTPARAPAREAVREARPVADEDDEGDAAPVARKRSGMLEVRHPLTGEILTRDVVTSNASPYDIPRHLWPQGMIYEWKRASVYGQEDKANILALERNGWRKLPADRHPDRSCELDGLVLMECPEQFVKASQDYERSIARQELKGKEAPLNLPGGFDDRADNARKVQFTRRGAPEVTDSSLRPSRSYSLDE